MKALKDHFSTQAEVYAKFRPRYPDALFEFLFSVTARALATPTFTITAHWTDEQLIGYLNSWSEVQNFMREKRTNPVELLKPRLQKLWSDREMKDVRFPLFMNVGRI